MVSLTALWLPILLSAVLAFVASTISHMVVGWHAADWKKFSSEDAVLDALRPFNFAPGDYAAPRPSSMAEANTPEFKAKAARGPLVLLTVLASPGSMARSLALWFVFLIVVSAFAGYVAGISIAPGAAYLTVFRVTSTVAFAGYALALWPNWIWYSKSLGYSI